MIQWLNLTDQERRITLAQAAAASGINAKSIEKDWWVTLTLKALFQTPYAEFLIFKGGTSLSKCWKLIERFSEDIDLALDPQAFGEGYKPEPTKSYLKKLKRIGCAFTSEALKDALEQQLLAMGIDQNAFELTAEEVDPVMRDKDPQTLFLKYASLYDPIPYLADEVKIEVSVRSKLEPHEQVAIQSLLTEHFPNEAYLEDPMEITVVKPYKTFLEKAFLLHEEFAKPNKEKMRSERMSRHLYDLEKMMDTEVAETALADEDFYFALIDHRSRYSGLTGVDYGRLSLEHIDFYPPDHLLDAYHTDYQTMKEVMIYGESLPPDALFARIKELVERFRATTFAVAAAPVKDKNKS